MEVPKATLDHHNRKKTVVKIPAVGGGGGVAAIGAVLLLGGALATAAFVRRGWNSGKDRRCRQDHKNGAQDGSFGAAEAAPNVPKELSGAVQDIEPDTVASVGESTQQAENPRVEIEGGILIDGCDSAAVEQSPGPAILGNDAVSASTNEDETLRFEAENMMNGGEVKIPLIEEDPVTEEDEINKANNFALVYDGDVRMKCEHGVEEKGLVVLYANSGEKHPKIEDGENGVCDSEEANGDEKEHATKKDCEVESVVGDELVKEQERFGQGGDAVGPKAELIPVAEGNTPCAEENIAAETPVVDEEDEPLIKCGLCRPASNEGGLERSFDSMEAVEGQILPENVEDKVEEEEEEPEQVVELKENNVVGQQVGDMIFPKNVEDEAEEEELVQVAEVIKENDVVGQPKQHEDNVNKDTADEVEKVESAIADDVAMRMSGDSSEIVEESSLETSDSCTDTQHLSDVVVEGSSVETSDSCTITQYLPVVEESSLETGSPGNAIDDSDHSSEVVIKDSSAETDDSKSETTLPPEALPVPCQEQTVIQEVEGKILEDTAAKTEAREGDDKGFHTIPYSDKFCILPEKRVMKKYVVELVKLKTNRTRRAVAVGTVWLWFSWFFGLSLVKLCAIVALTMALSKIQGY